MHGENVLDTTPQSPPSGPREPLSSGGSWRPADYYETSPPPAPERRGCPKWVPITCGTLGCLGLLIIVGGGFYAARNLPRLLNYYFSTVEREIDRTATAEVTAEQKAALRKELQRFRANLEKGETASDAQSIVLDLNRAIRDQRLTPEEVENLTRRLRDANDRLENKPSGTSVSGPSISGPESLVPSPGS